MPFSLLKAKNWSYTIYLFHKSPAASYYTTELLIIQHGRNVALEFHWRTPNIIVYLCVLKEAKGKRIVLSLSIELCLLVESWRWGLTCLYIRDQKVPPGSFVFSWREIQWCLMNKQDICIKVERLRIGEIYADFSSKAALLQSWTNLVTIKTNENKENAIKLFSSRWLNHVWKKHQQFSHMLFKITVVHLYTLHNSLKAHLWPAFDPWHTSWETLVYRSVFGKMLLFLIHHCDKMYF